MEAALASLKRVKMTAQEEIKNGSEVASAITLGLLLMVITGAITIGYLALVVLSRLLAFFGRKGFYNPETQHYNFSKHGFERITS